MSDNPVLLDVPPIEMGWANLSLTAHLSRFIAISILLLAFEGKITLLNIRLLAKTLI